MKARISLLFLSGLVGACASPSRPEASPPPLSPAPTAASVVDSPATVDWDAAPPPHLTSENVVPPEPRRPGEWIATPPSTPGLDLWDFTVVAQPGPEYARGVVAALGASTNADKPGGYVVRVDVATGKELSRLAVGDFVYGITHTKSSIVLSDQRDNGLELAWVDLDGRAIGATRLLRDVGVGSQKEVRGFAGFDDRLVIATGGYGSTYVRLFDDGGKQLSSHVCHGGIFNPGYARFVRMGDEVVLSDLHVDEKDTFRPALCGFFLHGPPRWREATLPYGEVYDANGRVYFDSVEDDSGWRGLTQDLRLGAPNETPEMPKPCWGLTGTGNWNYEVVGEYPVIWRIACCGDFGGGLFICRPPPEGERSLSPSTVDPARPSPPPR